MRKKRILLFSAQKLFGESIEHTLRGIPDLEVAGHWRLDDSVLEKVTAAAPDLVIITDEGLPPKALSRLTARILECHPDLAIFRVTLERNEMLVYSSHLAPARSSDLIDLIQRLPLE